MSDIRTILTEEGSYINAFSIHGYEFNVKWVPRRDKKGEIQNYEASTSLTYNENFKTFHSLKNPDKYLVLVDLMTKVKDYMEEHDIRK